MSADRAPASVIWALGVTQIVGYGTLFYSFAILAPDISATLGWPQAWIFGALSLSLIAGSVVAPSAGRLADRLGAGRTMTAGSLAAAASLAFAAAAPSAYVFVAALFLMQVAASFVLYSSAFVAIVQVGGSRASLSITHLTLIAGFASTLFWPLTTWLHGSLDWRQVFLVFAALHLVVCLPLHGWIASHSRRSGSMPVVGPKDATPTDAPPSTVPRAIFALMLAGFATEGFVLNSVLIHMVPLTAALGMGAAGLWASTLFGPAQVASRLVNMVFGGRLSQTWLAVISAFLLPAGLLVLVATTPWLPGALVFVVMFGMGSGLNSIVGGTLPLELFGRPGYGAMVGWATSAKQFSSAFAPFAFSAMLAGLGVVPSLLVLVVLSAAAVGCFSAIAVLRGATPRRV
ncbi:arsenite efflux MFS transporter ArsK [Mesorhizobium australicum]|uniref:Predicted arabinose efflux permease, MFS family n=1 Tax=Mesorhizobium australicum TaxID=536018 RepID=A0A1X7NQU6_9HYPH|nr:arsenite efflux MFS transporter ArsK [Mesorhizobium australicum]SMH40418.1 Predicted arabinose efflux permease, MFS family [Mesorhizobium australicum]